MDPQYTSELSDILGKSYFWDIDTASGRPVSDRLIIERVTSFGTLAELHLLLKYYGKEKVEKTLSELNYIDPKTLNFISRFFGKPKKEFRCYTRKQSMPKFWNC